LVNRLSKSIKFPIVDSGLLLVLINKVQT